MSSKYSYIDINKNRKEIEISDELYNKAQQGLKDYNTSFSYIQNQEYYIWRQALKSYHLSTYDRQKKIQNWQQNITIWLVRSFVDVLISTVQEKPLTFIWTWINKKWVENKENILKTLAYISDVTWFHTQIKKTLANWLIIWEICMRVWYRKTRKQESVISIINDTYIEETIDIIEQSLPYAENVSIFNVFPDMYSWPLRYVTERWVVSYEEFIRTFWAMIRDKKNESPFLNDDFLKLLPINPNNADFTDYGNIVWQIHSKINEQFKSIDTYNQDQKFNTINTIDTPDKDWNVTDWLIEFLITYYPNRIVLSANWYPVYIWPNIYWFIPYVIKAANETDLRFWEWVPYMMKWIEDVGNSFMNNYLDSARSIANPTLVVNKNLLINEDEIEDW